jgi:hypothetical protein
MSEKDDMLLVDPPRLLESSSHDDLRTMLEQSNPW